MSHEKACPTQVLILSTKSSTLCMAEILRRVGGGGSLFCRSCHISDGDQKKHHPVGRMVLPRVRSPSGLLGGRSLAEVVVVGHALADLGIEIPAHRPLGIFFLRFGDLLPHRVLRRLLLVDLVKDLELLL